MAPPFPPPHTSGHGASDDRAGVSPCVCLGGSSAISLHTAMQELSVGWQSFVSLALLGAGPSPSGGCFVSQKSVLVSLASTSWFQHRSGFGPWWCALSITGIVCPGQSSLELGLLDLPPGAATTVCPGTDRTRTVPTCCFLAEQRWEGGRDMHLEQREMV